MTRDAPRFEMHATCRECPWRCDVPVGKFPPERFRRLANTAVPGGIRPVFACHLTPDGAERACAGFLLVCRDGRAHDNNLVRLSRVDLTTIEATGPLFGSYRKMAEANGVAPDDPALRECP